jgi:hypothetical protein
MVNVKEILGSLFMMFGIIITIGATFSVMFFYYFFGPHWEQVLISLTVLLISLGVLVVGIILYQLSKKSEEVIKLASYMGGKAIAENIDSNLSVVSENLEKKLLLFVSYATKDVDTFKVHEIASKLIKFPEIENVLYWEEHLEDNIFEYMDENLEKCDAMILFCSEYAKNSAPVKKE